MNGLESLNILPGKRDQKINLVCDYMKSHLGMHNVWYFKFIFCEILYFANVIGNLYLTNVFFGGQFFSYGTNLLDVINEDPEIRDDPMSVIFPKVTKCTFHKYGPSGTIERNDAMCVLAQNIVSEKVYVFIWFWFIILSVITGLSLAYRLFTIAFPEMRLRALSVYGRIRGRPNVLYTLSRYLSVGDWYLLVLISQNMDPTLYSEFILKLTKSLDSDRPAEGEYVDTTKQQ